MRNKISKKKTKAVNLLSYLAVWSENVDRWNPKQQLESIDILQETFVGSMVADHQETRIRVLFHLELYRDLIRKLKKQPSSVLQQLEIEVSQLQEINKPA